MVERKALPLSFEKATNNLICNEGSHGAVVRLLVPGTPVTNQEARSRWLGASVMNKALVVFVYLRLEDLARMYLSAFQTWRNRFHFVAGRLRSSLA